MHLLIEKIIVAIFFFKCLHMCCVESTLKLLFFNRFVLYTRFVHNV